MRTTLEIPETGCTEHNLQSERDGGVGSPGSRLNEHAHGCSRAIEEVQPAVKALEVHFEGIGEE